MIINEVTDYNESVQFLLAMRKAVLESLMTNTSLSDRQRANFKEFVVNEATDYEIMHFAMRNTFPEEKSNINEEFLLFSELKEQLLVNYESLSAIMDPQDISIFMETVGPIGPEMSTALPILEGYLKEGSDDDATKKELAIAAGKKIVGQAATKGKELAGAAAGHASKAYDAAKEKGHEALKYAGEKAASASHAAGVAGRGIKRAVMGGEAEGSGRASATPGLVGHAKDAAGHVASAAKSAGSHVASAAHSAVEKGGQMASAANTAMGGHGVAALAATALAGVAAYGATKIYKRFFSQAARACAGKSGPQKDACMKQFKMKATQAKIAALNKSKATCKKSKNPQKCVAAIQAEIQKAQSSAGK